MEHAGRFNYEQMGRYPTVRELKNRGVTWGDVKKAMDAETVAAQNDPSIPDEDDRCTVTSRGTHSYQRHFEVFFADGVNRDAFDDDEIRTFDANLNKTAGELVSMLRPGRHTHPVSNELNRRRNAAAAAAAAAAARNALLAGVGGVGAAMAGAAADGGN